MHPSFEKSFAKNLVAPSPANPSKRFAIYRNNVFVSLVEALKARFPAVRKAVGAEFFDAMARDYAGLHRPASPVMFEYGENFPDFIDTFAPLADYRWIGDLARLECAITKSHHAADATPLSPEHYARINEARLADAVFTMTPSLFIIASQNPIVSLWRVNTDESALTDYTAIPAETALVHRIGWTVHVQAVTAAGGVFFTQLRAGSCLGEATAAAVAIDPDFDLSVHLQCLIEQALATSLSYHHIQ